MSGFANQILGGASKLIRAAIQSPDFLTGVRGWSIFKNGSAEFNNSIFRGTITVTGANGQQIVLGIISGSTAALQFFSGSVHELTPAEILSGLLGTGATQIIGTTIQGPQENVAGATDWVKIQMSSNNVGGTSVAQIGFIYVDDAQVNHLVIAVTNNALVITDQSPIPSAFANQVALYSIDGNLKFISGNDGNNYSTGRLTLITQSLQTITSTSPAQVGNLAATLQSGTYTIRAWIPYTEIAAAGSPTARITTASAATPLISFEYIKNATSPAYTTQPFNTLVNGPVMSSGKAMLRIEATFTLTTGATISIQMGTTANVDTYSIPAGAKLEVFPV